MRRTAPLALSGALLVAIAATATSSRAAPTDPQKCESDVEKASGKFTDCRLKAESSFTKTGDAAKLATAQTKCATKLSDAFTKAQTKYAGCPMTAAESAFDAFLTQCSDQAEAAASGGALPGFIPATGQTTAFTADRNDGVPGAVAVPDDGTLERGAALAFVDNGDGTITDSNTGLMWEKKDDNNAGGIHDKDNTYRWSGTGAQETIWDWLDDVNAEGGTGFAGHNDWRIPNVQELQSIVNYGTFSPAVKSELHTGCVAACTVTTCSCTVSSVYWSSSTYAPGTTFAWGVDFSDGTVNVGSKTTGYYVRAVRAGS